MKTYTQRNAVLAEMGFSSYRQYLESEVWKDIRNRALDFHGRRCRLCNAYTRTLHHLSYSRRVLEGEDLLMLVPLCGGCHLSIEFTPHGHKRTFESSRETYQKKLAESQFSLLPPTIRSMSCRRRLFQQRMEDAEKWLPSLREQARKAKTLIVIHFKKKGLRLPVWLFSRNDQVIITYHPASLTCSAWTRRGRFWIPPNELPALLNECISSFPQDSPH